MFVFDGGVDEGMEEIANEGAFPRTGDATDEDESSEGQVKVLAFEVAEAGREEGEPIAFLEAGRGLGI